MMSRKSTKTSSLFEEKQREQAENSNNDQKGNHDQTVKQAVGSEQRISCLDS